MEIIRGKMASAKKVVVYGPEGIGKSTFASRFPDPLFIDTEGSTKDIDVARFQKPSSWTMLLEQVKYVRDHSDVCKTLVIDTLDWAEAMCIEHICNKHQKDGLESFGYGNGYVYVREEFGRFLNLLEDVVESGKNVVLTAHAQMRKFEQPDEMGAYDRWELKLGKKTASQISPLVKEFSDMVLFANYKTYSVAVDDKGKKRKAQGGSRVMYTAHHPCWDAKNRYGLPEEMPFDYAGIAGIIEQAAGSPSAQAQSAASARTTAESQTSITAPQNASATRTANTAVNSAGSTDVMPRQPVEQSPDRKTPDTASGEAGGTADGTWKPIWESNPDNIPQNLKDLMFSNRVCEWDIQNVVAARGYYPPDTPMENYDPGFIQGVLVGAWPKVFAMIKEMKEKMEIPFN